MAVVSMTGIVVKQVKVGDYDKILTLLSPEHGKVQVSAKGVRSLKNKNSAGCNILAYSSFELKEGKEMYALLGCDLKENFYHLREDLYRLGVGCYMGEVAAYVAREGEPCPELCRLLLNSLFFLQKEEVSPKALKAIFELRLLREEGLSPEVSECVFCGNTERLEWFDPRGGSAVCEECKEPHLLKVTPHTLRAIGAITGGSLKEAFTYPLNETVIERMGKISEQMILMHIAPRFRSLEYLKSLEE